MLEPGIETAPREAIRKLQVTRLVAQLPRFRQFASYATAIGNVTTESTLEVTAITDGDAYRAAGQEAFARCDSVYYLENTSGTTGTPKSRIVSFKDDAIDVRVLARSFVCAGIEASSRVLFLDCGEPNLFAIGVKALALINNKHSLYWNIRKPFGRNVLSALESSGADTLFTIPGILQRAIPALTSRGLSGRTLKRIIYTGEALEPRLRRTLSKTLRVEIFSLYSSVELGFIGSECSAHDGMHVWADCVLPRLAEGKPLRRSVFRRQSRTVMFGRFCATSLLHDAKPCLNYDTGDFVYLTEAKCSCGRTMSRIAFSGRRSELFSVLNSKFSFRQIQDLVYDREDITNLLRIELRRQGDASVMTIVLPYESLYSETERKLYVRHSITSFPGLGFFIEQGLLDCRIEFAAADDFMGRKIKRIIDRRGDSPDRMSVHAKVS